MASGLFRLTNKKSLLYLLSVTGSPLLILCAFMMISLSAACLKIFSSFTTSKQPEWIISFNTFPGPTLGNWSTSPTRIRRVPTAIAFSSEFIIDTSTMDISSTIMTSVSSGLSSFLSKCMPVFCESDALPQISSSLWIVCASYPLVSAIRFAARPVGAARRISRPSISKYLIMVLIVVVFPVPGPPVITINPFKTALWTACFWISSRIMSFFSSICAILWPISASSCEYGIFSSIKCLAIEASI